MEESYLNHGEDKMDLEEDLKALYKIDSLLETVKAYYDSLSPGVEKRIIRGENNLKDINKIQSDVANAYVVIKMLRPDIDKNLVRIK